MNNSRFDLRQLPDELVSFINTYLVNQKRITNYILSPRVLCNNLVPNKMITISEVITRSDNRLELIPVYDDIDKMKVEELKEELRKTRQHFRSNMTKPELKRIAKLTRGTLILSIEDILSNCPDIILNINIYTKQYSKNNTEWL